VPAGGPSPFADRKIGDPANLPLSVFELQFDEFVERYAVMDTSSPDISEFAERGGKTIIWHGVADDVIPAAGTLHYVESIRRLLGSRKADTLLRLYLAPGVGHCAGGIGPQPVALMEPLMNWVEHGRSPAALRSENWNEAGNFTRTRPLCPYPEQARYRGQGSIDDAKSFRCQK
jgi:feruloyl esterase